MRSGHWLIVGALLFVSTITHAQVTNLIINGSSGSFSFTSGDAISWSFDIPSGATVDGEYWYDVNQNGTIEPDTDVARFIFTQTDGDTNGNGGPPDMDGLVNGHVVFMQPVGLAPGKYVGKFTHNASSLERAGTVLALASPAHVISGHVTPPSGRSAQYIIVEVHRNESAGQPNSWDAFTDASGNYSIEMNADTAGNPWRVRIETNPYPPSIISPQEIDLIITDNHFGNNFVFVTAAAQVVGMLVDQDNQPLAGRWVEVQQDSTYLFHSTNSDGSGFFQIGLPSSELGSKSWKIYTSDGGDVTTSMLEASIQLPVINIGDSLYRILRVYSVDSQISGQLRVNGNPPGYPIKVTANSPDFGRGRAWADSLTGNFIIPVSSRISAYDMGIEGLPYGYTVQPTTGHPGDTGIVINVMTQTNVLVNWSNGWNMISLPLRVPNNQTTSIYPSAASSVYSYSTASGYQPQTYLYNGLGYWVKFNGTGSTGLNGYTVSQESIAVFTGWNLIGAISTTIATSTVASNPSAIVVSPYYEYTVSGYLATTSLDPGKAFWVKVNQNGKLMLSSTSNMPGSAISRTEWTTELPPPPPPSVESTSSDRIPVIYELGQNYPNPFNPTASIEYALPAASRVKLVLYNTLGEQVRQLVDGEMAAGIHHVTIDGANLTGGVYFYRMTAIGVSDNNHPVFSSMRKMLLIK